MWYIQICSQETKKRGLTPGQFSPFSAIFFFDVYRKLYFKPIFLESKTSDLMRFFNNYLMDIYTQTHACECMHIYTHKCVCARTHTHAHTWPHYQAWAHTQMFVGEGVVKVNMWAVVWCQRGAGCVYNSLTLTLTLAMHLRLPYLQPLILQFYWQFHWLHGSGSWFKFNKGVESGET